MRSFVFLALALMAAPALGQCEGGVCRKLPQASLPLYSAPALLVVGQPVRNVVKVASVPVRIAAVPVKATVAVVGPPVVNTVRVTAKVATSPVEFVRRRKPVRRAARVAARVATAPVRFVFRGCR